MSDFVNTVDLIGDDALTDGLIGGTLTELKDDRARTIRAHSFDGNESLVTVDCPNVTSIGELAFSATTALSTANFQSVTTTGTKCFQAASALAKINMPLVTAIRDYVFNGCTSLEKVCLPSVTGTGDGAFNGCSSLKILDLPKIKGIGGHNTLDGCTALIALILRSDAVTTVNYGNAIDSCGISAGTCYIYVPRALVDSYKAATNWSTYADQFRALEDYTVDGTTTGELDETKI